MNDDQKEKNRKLSESEKRRLARFEENAARIEEKGFKRRDLTIGIVKANIYAVLLAIPVMIFGFVLFFAVNHEIADLTLSGREMLIFLAAYIILILVHELIHGLTWACFAENRFRSIEFGFMKEYLTPYCVCNDSLGKWQYIAGALAPLIILGIIPAAVGIITGNALVFWIGLVMIFSAGGDFLIVMLILIRRSTGSEDLYLDHPTQAGVVVFERQL